MILYLQILGFHLWYHHDSMILIVKGYTACRHFFGENFNIEWEDVHQQSDHRTHVGHTAVQRPYLMRTVTH